MCYSCSEVPNYSDSRLFHGGDTGSTLVLEAKDLRFYGNPAGYLASDTISEIVTLEDQNVRGGNSRVRKLFRDRYRMWRLAALTRRPPMV